MTNQVYTTKQIQDILFPVFTNHSVKKAILFGSYAKGVAKENSDIDIMVDSGLKGLRFFGLLEDVVTSLNKDVDLIDVRQIENGSEVQKEIENTGVVIYG